MITRKFIHDHPATVFVFGDNFAGKGLGGQAKEARGEYNTVGIPTKWFPDNRPSSFFSDDEFFLLKRHLDAVFRDIKLIKRSGHKIVFFPRIGMGLADLQNRAPKTLAYIREKIVEIGGGDLTTASPEKRAS